MASFSSTEPGSVESTTPDVTRAARGGGTGGFVCGICCATAGSAAAVWRNARLVGKWTPIVLDTEDSKTGCDTEGVDAGSTRINAPGSSGPAQRREPARDYRCPGAGGVCAGAPGNARLIPMQAIPAEFQRLESLSDDADLLVFCHHGVRSLQVVNWLREHGIENCYSVTGGLDRWSREIDPGIPRY